MAAYQRLLDAAPSPSRGAIVLTWNFDNAPVEDGDTYAELYAGTSYTGNVLLTKRRHAYPRLPTSDDSQVVELDSFTFGTPPTYPAGAQTFTDEDVEPGVTYYYALLFERTDGTWSYYEDGPFLKDGRSFAKAYAYDPSFDYAARLEAQLPAFYKTDDEDGHLSSYLSIFGYLLDGARTDVEQLLNLSDTQEVDASLLGNHAALIDWPVNWEINESRQRREVAQATALYKQKGRAVALETVIQIATSWNATLYEGWRYLLITNSSESGTVDTVASPAALSAAQDTEDDLFRYTPDLSSTGWHNTFGVLAVLDQITGSEPLTTLNVGKMHRLAPDFLANYARLSLLIRPDASEEVFEGAYNEDDEVLLEIADTDTFSGGYTEDTPVAVLSAGFSLFETNAAASTTNANLDRLMHTELTYT